MTQIKAVHRPWKVGAVVVPEQQIKRRRLLPLEVLVDVVVPPQLVRAQQRKGIAHVFGTKEARLIATTTNIALVIGHQLFINEHADWPGIQIVEEGRKQTHAADCAVAARRQYRQRSTEQRAANAEAHAVEPLFAADCPGHLQRRDHTLFDQVIPGLVGVFLVKIAPGHHEHRMPLFQQVADH
ncbi:hypothetical protein D3C81_1139980 [compost metagenome]